MPDLQLPAWEAKVLYNALKNKLKDEYKKRSLPENSIPEKVTVISGYNNDDSKLNLHDLINQNMPTTAFLKTRLKKAKDIPSQFLYELCSFADSKYDKGPYISLNEHYINALYFFLGEEKARQGFLEKHTKDIHFDGYYYSALNTRIQGFSLTLTIQTLLEDKDFVISVKEKGYHSLYNTIELSGSAEVVHKYLLMKLRNGNHILNISLHFGGERINAENMLNLEQLFGIISGSTSHDTISAAEVVLIKKTAIEDSIDQAVIKPDLFRMLYLKRNLFVVDINEGRVMHNLTELKVDEIRVKEVTGLANKTFRILNAAKDGGVVQSIFKINNDCSAEITIPGVSNDRPMMCFLSTSNMRDRKLIVYVYRERKILYSTTIIEIPHRLSGQINIFNGAFCVCDDMHDPLGNIFVMGEEPDRQAASPKRYSKKEIDEVTKDELGKQLYDKLKSKVDKWLDSYQNWGK